MTQPKSIDRGTATLQGGEIGKNGLFLVKPISRSHAIPAPEPQIARRSRSMGVLALAGAAMAAPLLWFLHEMLTKLLAR